MKKILLLSFIAPLFIFGQSEKFIGTWDMWEGGELESTVIFKSGNAYTSMDKSGKENTPDGVSWYISDCGHVLSFSGTDNNNMPRTQAGIIIWKNNDTFQWIWTEPRDETFTFYRK